MSYDTLQQSKDNINVQLNHFRKQRGERKIQIKMSNRGVFRKPSTSLVFPKSCQKGRATCEEIDVPTCSHEVKMFLLVYNDFIASAIGDKRM